MALGRTFQESFQKFVRSLETGHHGWGCEQVKELQWDWEQLKYGLRLPSPNRIYALYAAMNRGMSTEEIHELCYIDSWFLLQLRELLYIEGILSITNFS